MDPSPVKPAEENGSPLKAEKVEGAEQPIMATPKPKPMMVDFKMNLTEMLQAGKKKMRVTGLDVTDGECVCCTVVCVSDVIFPHNGCFTTHICTCMQAIADTRAPPSWTRPLPSLSRRTALLSRPTRCRAPSASRTSW